MDNKELIFNMYKDEVITCNQFEAEIKEKYNITGDDARNLFMRIQNYQIFNMYKDQVLIAKRFKVEIIKKFNVSKVEAGDIFARIQNYQIKKYGKRLDFSEPAMTSEEKKYISLVARTRNQSKKRKYYENTKMNRKYEW